MSNLKVLGKNVHLDIGEQEIYEALQETYEITEQQALDHVIRFKRDQAAHYEQMGNFELAEHILRSIDEWSDDRAQFYKQKQALPGGNKKIIIPGN